MVVVQLAQIPEKVAQKTVPKLFQTKDRTKFTNIIGVSLRTIKIFGSRTWLKKTGKKEKRFTRIYHFDNGKGQGVRVYQKVFLSTIGLTTDKTTGTVLSKSEGSRTNHITNTRGKAEPANKKKR